jgi:outer membrane protein
LSICSCAASRPGKLIATTLLALLLALPAEADGRDLSLAEAIELAIGHDHALQAAASDSEAAHLDYLSARAQRFPGLSVQARTSRKDEIPSLDLEPLGIARQIGSKEVHQIDATVRLPLFTGGRISGLVKAGRETSLAETARLEAARMHTAYRCRRAYLELMRAEALLRSAESSSRRLSIIQQDVESMYESGLADSLDLFEAAIAVERGRQQIADKQALREIAEANLKTCTGLDAAEPLRAADQVPVPDRPLAEAGPDAPPITERPELRQLAHVANAAEHAASIARAASFPSLAAFAGYSAGKPNQDLFNSDWNDYMMAGLSLNWDFNLAGGTIRSTSAASKRAEAARLMHMDLLEKLMLQSAVAVESARRAYATMGHSGRQLELARRRYALAAERQHVGLLPANRLIEMEDDLRSLEEQHRASIIECHLAETDYLYAIGSTKIFGGLR